jgi:hypothetical protein
MTATVEKYSAALAERERELEQLRARVVELREHEQAAVAESISVAPSRLPFADLNSPASKAKRARVKAEERLAAVERIVPLLREQAARESRGRAQRFLEAQLGQLGALDGEVAVVWEKLSGLYLELARTFVREAGRVGQARERLLQTLAGLANAADLRERAERAWAQPSVRPLPVSFAQALEQLRGDTLAETFADEPEVAAVLNGASNGFITTAMLADSHGLPNAGFGSGQVIRRGDD